MKNKKKPLGYFCKLAVKYGAKEAKIISTRNDFTAPWVRMKCQYGCGGYGQTLTCPPYSPKPEDTRKLLDCYKKAILVHCDDRWNDVKGLVVKLEREVFLNGYYKAFGIGAGPCGSCRACNLKKCKHPDQSRPAMEACGIDVFKTARKNDYKIEVLTDTGCRGNYFGLVLVE